MRGWRPEYDIRRFVVSPTKNVNKTVKSRYIYRLQKVLFTSTYTWSNLTLTVDKHF